MRNITLRLKLHKPTRAKRALYAELTRRTTELANNLVAAGRPQGLTSKTAAPYLPERIPSAVVNQALRHVRAHKRVERFRVLPPSFNNQNLKLAKAGEFWTAAFPTQNGRVRVPLAITERQARILEQIGSTVKQGAAKLYQKRGRWYFDLSIAVPEATCSGRKMAGVEWACGTWRSSTVKTVDGAFIVGASTGCSDTSPTRQGLRASRWNGSCPPTPAVSARSAASSTKRTATVSASTANPVDTRSMPTL